MRVPTDRPLAQWIRELIAIGRLYRFYKTEEWRGLRQLVLDRSHNECERCRERGVPKMATTVHHVMEVKDRPDLALSLTYTDREGAVHRQLVALCDACHNEVHGRFQGAKCKRGDERPLTDERW